MTFTELSRLTKELYPPGISEPQVSRWLSGRRNVSKDSAKKLAKILGITPEQAMFGDLAELKKIVEEAKSPQKAA